MLHTNEGFAKAVEDAVARAEARTDAEIVVVAAERSGAYRDVAMLTATVICGVLLALQLWLPWSFPPLFVLIDLVVAWPLLVWLAQHPRFLRLVVPRTRLAEQARTAAESEFVREAVHGTPNRTGVLVYVSALEGVVEIVPDLGISGRIAPGELVGVRAEFVHDDLDHFVRGLDRLGEVLGAHVPHTAESDAIDLPNAPRVRP